VHQQQHTMQPAVKLNDHSSMSGMFYIHSKMQGLLRSWISALSECYEIR